MDHRDLVDLIVKTLPQDLATPAELEAKYPPRVLPEGAMVTRVAPSPTGFVHIGTVYTAMICERLAHQTNGTFFLRIEDTDTKRELAGAADLIVDALTRYDVRIDEGQTLTGSEVGAYGPYKQSDRASIYLSYLKELLARDLAYPCFCSPDELDAMRSQQELLKTRTGYYGTWAKCRHLSPADAVGMIQNGKSFVMRFKSPGDFNKKIVIEDLLIEGARELPENDQEIILVKSDGLPTYHFAHVVDDHLMRTTHVIRGDEWFSSVPLHIQLFQVMGWTVPRYGHLAPIQKLDEGKKRKLSKRKDPEASVSYFDEQGYPRDGVIEYLLNLANSNFEDWRKENPVAANRDFILTLEKLARSAGALFDFDKLTDISKDVVSRMLAEEVYDLALAWAKKYDADLAKVMEREADYSKQILNIERGMGEKARKDIAKWSDVRNEVIYFYDSEFKRPEDLNTLLSNMSESEIDAIVKAFLADYHPADDKDTWLAKMRAMSINLGYADTTKTYKADPSKFKGSISDVTKVLRVMLTGKTQTPDLYQVLQVMGMERVKARLMIKKERF